MSDRKIKLIWDFKGTEAHFIAMHHEQHLKEFILDKNLGNLLTGHKALGELHSIAFMVVAEGTMPQVRDALKPHRGELFDEA